MTTPRKDIYEHRRPGRLLGEALHEWMQCPLCAKRFVLKPVGPYRHRIPLKRKDKLGRKRRWGMTGNGTTARLGCMNCGLRFSVGVEDVARLKRALWVRSLYDEERSWREKHPGETPGPNSAPAKFAKWIAYAEDIWFLAGLMMPMETKRAKRLLKAMSKEPKTRREHRADFDEALARARVREQAWLREQTPD
jgi:hypothetical protein